MEFNINQITSEISNGNCNGKKNENNVGNGYADSYGNYADLSQFKGILLNESEIGVTNTKDKRNDNNDNEKKNNRNIEEEEEIENLKGKDLNFQGYTVSYPLNEGNFNGINNQINKDRKTSIYGFEANIDPQLSNNLTNRLNMQSQVQTTSALNIIQQGNIPNSINVDSNEKCLSSSISNIDNCTDKNIINNNQVESKYDDKDESLRAAILNAIETIPDFDEKRCCIFCHKTFSHIGSLGRHMDLKRGTRLHPAEEVDKLRSNVKRRGDIVEVRARRAKRAREYRARPEVKERAKELRKEKDFQSKVREIARYTFINQLGSPSLPDNSSFAYFVLYFLAPTKWPHDLPNVDTYEELKKCLDPSAYANDEFNKIRFTDWTHKMNTAFETWNTLSNELKLETWNKEIRTVTETTLGSLSLFKLNELHIWLANEGKYSSTCLSSFSEAIQNDPSSDVHSSSVGTVGTVGTQLL